MFPEAAVAPSLLQLQPHSISTHSLIVQFSPFSEVLKRFFIPFPGMEIAEPPFDELVHNTSSIEFLLFPLPKKAKMSSMGGPPLVVRVLDYRSGVQGSIPGTPIKKKVVGSGTGSTQPREYN
jgi:hypothetical protein